MSKVRYAVVGLRQGLEHVEIILKNNRAKLGAVCDLNRDNANQAVAQVQSVTGREKAEAVRVFDDYQKLLAWGEFDAVVIATPPMVHKDMAVQAIRAQKHVLLEKPMTITVAEADKIRAAYQGAKTVFQVYHELRCSQFVRKLMEMIHSGRIGDVLYVWWHMFYKHGKVAGWRTERKNMGPMLFDCCCHTADLLRMFAGASFYRLSAFGDEPGQVGPSADRSPKVATVNYEYQNGVRGDISLSEISPTPETSLFGVIGSNGIIYGNPWRPEGAGSLDCYTEGALFREQITITANTIRPGHLGGWEQHEGFMDAILLGTKPPCSLDDGYEAVLMTVATDRSIATGKVILRDEVVRAK